MVSTMYRTESWGGDRKDRSHGCYGGVQKLCLSFTHKGMLYFLLQVKI